jgi:hypothetical protein
LLFSCIPALAASRMSCEIRMEQNFGPHMEQKRVRAGAPR